MICVSVRTRFLPFSKRPSVRFRANAVRIVGWMDPPQLRMLEMHQQPRLKDLFVGRRPYLLSQYLFPHRLDVVGVTIEYQERSNSRYRMIWSDGTVRLRNQDHERCRLPEHTNSMEANLFPAFRMITEK